MFRAISTHIRRHALWLAFFGLAALAGLSLGLLCLVTVAGLSGVAVGPNVQAVALVCMVVFPVAVHLGSTVFEAATESEEVRS